MRGKNRHYSNNRVGFDHQLLLKSCSFIMIDNELEKKEPCVGIFRFLILLFLVRFCSIMSIMICFIWFSCSFLFLFSYQFGYDYLIILSCFFFYFFSFVDQWLSKFNFNFQIKTWNYFFSYNVMEYMWSNDIEFQHKSFFMGCFNVIYNI